MAAKLLLFTVLLSFSAILVQASDHGSFAIGTTYGAHLIYHKIHNKFPMPFMKRDKDFTVKAANNELIRAVIVSDLEGNGLGYIKEGGIGQHQVKIHLEAYCQSFYSCSLWVNYTQRAYSTLRVQYNNACRVLMGLPRYCSASGMFAEAGIDGFHAIMRKRCASIMRRVRVSPNSILKTIADRWDSPILGHWMGLHCNVGQNK